MIYEVKIPQINVNEDSVIINEWYVKEGDYVDRETPLCSIETSKATLDLEAETAGYVKFLKYQVGDKIPMQETVCYIVDSMETEIPIDLVVKQKKISGESFSSPISATDKARRLAEKLGIELSKISKNGIVRERDVLKFHEGGVNIQDEFLKSISDDESFRNLPSESKVSGYRLNGAKIGENVIFGKGSVIVAPKISIGDDVSIGENTYIETDQLSIGKMVKIGRDCYLVSGAIKIGDVTTVADRVIFDLSGGKSNLSKVIIGNRCLLANEVYLNSSRTINIGDYVALSPRAIIYTHSYWQSVLEGYSASYDNVTIDENSWIGSAAQLLPGTKVGKGSMVMSNSLVTSPVLPYTMVGGIPAFVIKKQLKKELSLETKNKILSSLIEEFAEFLKERGCSVNIKKNESYIEYIVNIARKQHQYRLILALNAKGIDATEENAIYIGLKFNQVSKKTTIFDIGKNKISGSENIITNELRNFLCRRGIIFSPIYWRYNYRKGL